MPLTIDSPAPRRSLFGFRSRNGRSTDAGILAGPPRFATTKRRARILVVEDDSFLREALRERLTHDGCEVTDTGDGGSARNFLMTGSYDVAILDLILPSSHGLDVMAAASHYGSSPPILVLTGGDAEERNLAWSLGAAFVLQKPSPYATIADAIDQLLN